MDNLVRFKSIVLPIILTITCQSLVLPAVATDHGVPGPSVDTNQLAGQVAAATGWKFLGLQTGKSSRKKKKVYLFEVSADGRPFARVEISDPEDLLKKIEVHGKPRVLYSTGRVYFSELERLAAAEISRRTGWSYRVSEDATTFSVWFNGGKDGQVQTENPSELLEKIRMYGRPKGTHGFTVFFPDHERAVAEEIGRRLGLTVSVTEKATVTAIFTDPSTGLSFSTSQAESLQEFLFNSDSPKERLNKLLDPEMFKAANDLAKVTGWVLRNVYFMDQGLTFLYSMDEKRWRVFETRNPQKELSKHQTSNRCAGLFTP